MRFIGYLRVSGLGQVDKDGEARQLEAVRTFCLNNKIELADTRFEAGVSGTVDGLDRPELSRIFESAEPVAIVLERLDRLARDLMVQELILKECRERGIKVYAADQHFEDLASNSGDPTRKLIRQILGALAEWEKSALVLKLRKARDRKRALTGRCEGVTPFCATPAGAKVMRYINELRILKVSYAQIARKLNQRKITTSQGSKWNKNQVLKYLETERKWKAALCVETSEKNQPTPSSLQQPAIVKSAS